MRSWLVLTLVALLIAVVAFAGWMLGRRAAPTAAGVAQTAQVGDMRVTVQIDQAALGPRVVDVAVRDAAGQPVDVRAVKLRFTMNEMDMGVIEADAQPMDKGHFQARGSFFSMVGSWTVGTTLTRDGQPAVQTGFAFPIAAPGEASGPLNPLTAGAQTLTAGRQLYQTNCVSCHGTNGKGDGLAAAGLNPRPADFTQHMVPGLHTDGQVFLWIKNGFPGTAMPAWDKRLTDEQIWQLVTYLRTFGRGATSAGRGSVLAPTPPPAQATPIAPAQPAPLQNSREPLPPLVFTRQGNIWRSDGSQAAPRQLTNDAADTYVQHPTVSPDGKQVAFVALIQPPATATLPLPTSALYVMNIDGTGQRTIWKPEQGLLSMPAWSPDGQALYVAANGIKAAPDANGSTRLLQIVRVDLANGATRPLLNDALDPSISRDGKQMAYLQLSKDGYTMTLMIAAPDGSGARQLIDGQDFQGFYAPRFSPDGKRIVVAAIGGPETDPQGNPIKVGGWSPLDGLLGLFAPPTAEAHGLPWDLWVVNADGSGLHRLTQFYEDLPMATFSPDGKQIAIMGAGGVYLMDADGGRLRRIDPVGDHGGLDWVRN